jgi:hypothetical protein
MTLTKTAALSSMVLVLLISVSVPTVFASNQAHNIGAVKPLSPSNPFCDPVTINPSPGIYAGPKGGVYFADQYAGGIWFCTSKGVISFVGGPPSGAPTGFYYDGLNGVVSKDFGLVLVVMNINIPGFWLCIGATTTGCTIVSQMITLPSGFCSTQPTGGCSPWGVVMDKKLNVYYADPYNQDVVKCTYSSQYRTCTEIENLSGSSPEELTFDPSGNLWVTDASTAGNVWENGVLQYSLSAPLGGIVWSKDNAAKTLQLYIAIDGGTATFPNAFVFDVTDDHILTPTFSGSSIFYSLTSNLQVSASSGDVIYQMTDST